MWYSQLGPYRFPLTRRPSLTLPDDFILGLHVINHIQVFPKTYGLTTKQSDELPSRYWPLTGRFKEHNTCIAYTCKLHRSSCAQWSKTNPTTREASNHTPLPLDCSCYRIQISYQLKPSNYRSSMQPFREYFPNFQNVHIPGQLSNTPLA